MEWGHGVAFWSVFWNGIKLDIGGGGGFCWLTNVN